MHPPTAVAGNQVAPAGALYARGRARGITNEVSWRSLDEYPLSSIGQGGGPQFVGPNVIAQNSVIGRRGAGNFHAVVGVTRDNVAFTCVGAAYSVIWRTRDAHAVEGITQVLSAAFICTYVVPLNDIEG